MTSWLFLIGAVLCEVIATTNLKLSVGFSKPIPSIIVVIGYCISFWMIAIAMKSIPLTIAYPVWAGIGTALVAISGMLLFHEVITPMKLLGIVVVVIGVILLNMSGVHRYE